MGDEEPTDLHRARLLLVDGDPHGPRQRPRPARRLRPRADVDVRLPRSRLGARRPAPCKGPSWLRQPADPNALVPHLWSTTAHKVDGDLTVGGVRAAPTWSPSTTPRRTSSTRPTSGPGPGRSATRSRRTTSSTPARRSSAPTVARWIAEEGLCLDVCSGGELTVALRAGFDPARIGYHGNNKTVRRAAPRGRRRRRPDHRRLVRRDRAARPQITARRSAAPPG